MNVWIVFAFYLVYRFFRFLVHSIQSRIIWKINGVNEHFERIENGSTRETCEISKIIYRKKFVEADMTSANDFVCWHEKFVDPKIVLTPDPNWTLYTLDDKFAYFVRMPNPWPWYNARRAPFVFMRQFTDATRLARIPLKTFCQFGEEGLPEPKGPVVYYSNAARSGSTLLLRIMQVSEERIVCVGEPDAFTALAILHERGYINDGLCIDLLKAIFKYYCKHQSPGQTYLMKLQSNGVRLVPFIKIAVPEVKHMFTYRRSTRRVLSSLEKILRGGTAGDVIVTLWNILPALACRAISYGGYEYEMCKRFGMRDCLDFAIIHHVASFYHYFINKRVFDIPLINYEDLVAEKEKTLQLVFKLCQLPFNEFANEALDEFKVDSQGGTILSQDNMKTVQDSVLDDEKVNKMNEMCDQLKIPHIAVE